MTAIIISSVILGINLILWIFVIRVIKKEFSVDGAIEKVKIGLDELVKEIDYTTARDVDLIDAKRNELNALIEKTDKKIKFLNDELSKRDVEIKMLEQISSEMQKKSGGKVSKSKNSDDEDEVVQKNASGKRAAKAVQAYSSNSGKTKKSSGDSNYQLFAENAGTSDFHRNIKVFDMPMTDGERTDEEAKVAPVAGKSIAESGNVVESETGFKIKIADEPIKPKAVTGNQIVALAEQGFDSEFIAKKLGISIAEVEMTMAFNGKI